ncbi:MAG: hypothetical protein FJ102_15375 [Deltaproteobacteria bacterium]|nr:hypothetical protein [Deltaproteobacteria bacterium]
MKYTRQSPDPDLSTPSQTGNSALFTANDALGLGVLVAVLLFNVGRWARRRRARARELEREGKADEANSLLELVESRIRVAYAIVGVLVLVSALAL